MPSSPPQPAASRAANATTTAQSRHGGRVMQRNLGDGRNGPVGRVRQRAVPPLFRARRHPSRLRGLGLESRKAPRDSRKARQLATPGSVIRRGGQAVGPVRQEAQPGEVANSMFYSNRSQHRGKGYG